MLKLSQPHTSAFTPESILALSQERLPAGASLAGAGDPTSCHDVHGMTAVGARRLSVEALQDMARHLETCVACSELFDPHAGEPMDDAAQHTEETASSTA